MRNYRTFTDVEESYFREHPEEIDDYITILFEEYAKDGDTGALLSSLQVLGRAKGLTKLFEEAGLSCKGIQKALSDGTGVLRPKGGRAL
jgi:DNA-binding phage protein